MSRLGAACVGGVLALVALLATAPGARASEMVVAGLSHHTVSLTTGFSGSEIFVYGAVRRTGATPEPEGKLDIIVTITGPSAPVVVRRKEKVPEGSPIGIWVNGGGVRIDAAPSFYVVATTDGLRKTITWTDDLRYHIGLDYIIRLIDAPKWVSHRGEYVAAVARIRERKGLYSILPHSVRTIENTLFQTNIRLPANLVEGDYTARVFLVRHKQVLDVFTDTISVRRAGLGRFIYLAAQDHAALYGAASLALALAAGWLASAFFRTFFPS